MNKGQVLTRLGASIGDWKISQRWNFCEFWRLELKTDAVGQAELIGISNKFLSDYKNLPINSTIWGDKIFRTALPLLKSD